MAKVYKRICTKTQTIKVKNGDLLTIERSKEYMTSAVRPDKTVVVFCTYAPFPVVPAMHFAGAVAL